MPVYISKNSEWDSPAPGNQLVASDFWGPLCPYCGPFKQVFEAAASEYLNIKFVKANVDQILDISSKYGTQEIPLVKFLCKNKEVREVAGCISKGNFKKEIHNMATSPISYLANLSSAQPSISSMMNGSEAE